MLRRAEDPDDPASGMIEFPGGGRGPGESTLQAAQREWAEEVGRPLPRGKEAGSYEGTNGIYRCHIWQIAREEDVHLENGRVTVDPDGNDEDTGWVSPQTITRSRAVRPELQKDADLALKALGHA